MVFSYLLPLETLLGAHIWRNAVLGIHMMEALVGVLCIRAQGNEIAANDEMPALISIDSLVGSLKCLINTLLIQAVGIK